MEHVDYVYTVGMNEAELDEQLRTVNTASSGWQTATMRTRSR